MLVLVDIFARGVMRAFAIWIAFQSGMARLVSAWR
jgi:hypothetical protein